MSLPTDSALEPESPSTADEDAPVQRRQAEDRPTFDREMSVIIATWNRSSALKKCLEALGSQTADPSDFEVIVVIDGPDRDAEEMLSALRMACRFTVVKREHGGQAAAANAGAQTAKGRFCLFLDDDIIPDRGLISAHLQVQRTSGGGLVMGHLEYRAASGDLICREFAREWDEHFQRLKAEGGLRGPIDCFGGNLSVPTEVFRSTGGFSTTLPRGYDAELARKIGRLQLPLLFAAEARGIHESDKGWRRTLDDFRKEGIGAVEIYRKNPELLPELMLGRFRGRSRRFNRLLRVMLVLRFPLTPLRLILYFIPGVRYRHASYSFLRHYGYWLGAKTYLTKDEWQSLTR